MLDVVRILADGFEGKGKAFRDSDTHEMMHADIW